MKKLKLTLGIIGLSVIAWISMYLWFPVSVFDGVNNVLGSTITTIAGSDTLKDSRAVINTNFSNLNTDKFELSDWYATTSAAQLTTLANVATLGTITSGIWNGTPVTVAFGGTGSTTLSSNQVLLGNGTGILKTVSGFGTSGQFLTSNGDATAPTWQSSTVNQNDNFTWAGNHLWTAAASSTLFGILDTLYIGRTASSTIQGSTTGTSTLQGFLNVSGTNSTSTFSGNLSVATTSTTALIVGAGGCSGCLSYTASSTVFSASTGTVTYTGSIPSAANFGMFKATISDTSDTYSEDAFGQIARSGITTIRLGSNRDTHDGRYEFSWSGANFSVQEITDESGDSSVSGTIYWYQ